MKLDGHVHEDKLGEESILVSFIVVTEFGSKFYICKYFVRWSELGLIWEIFVRGNIMRRTHWSPYCCQNIFITPPYPQKKEPIF